MLGYHLDPWAFRREDGALFALRPYLGARYVPLRLGATAGLDAIDCIKLEYNFEPMYEGQVRLPELVAFLDEHGFRRFVQVDLRLEYPTIHCCDFVFVRDPG